MKSITYSLSILFSCLLFTGFGQNLDIEGTAKVSGLTKDNSADSVVVILDDGTLGVREVSTIGGSGGVSSYIVGGGSSNNGFDDGRNNYIPMGGPGVSTTLYEGANSRIPQCGSLSQFEASINSATGDNIDYVFTVIKNGVDTDITCTINSGSTKCTDLVHSVTFEINSTIAINYVGNDGADNNQNRQGRWIGLYTPTTCPN